MTEFNQKYAPVLKSEFSRPIMRYRSNYPASEIDAKLSSPDAPIRELLHSYLDAKREVDQAWTVFTDGGSAVEFTKAYQRELRIYKEMAQLMDDI